MSRHSHDDTTHNIDGGDQKTRNRISFYIFYGTIHGTEKACLFLDFLSSLLCFRICNGSGVQIRINSHLLTGHCIQSKSRCYFGYTFRTFVDDHELDQDQNNEDNDTDDQITATYELTEGFHDITCITVSQDQTGG